MGSSVGVMRSAVSSPRKHRCAHYGKKKDRRGKGERDHAHPALLKPARSIGEEKHCGEQHGVGEILARNAAGRARLLLTLSSLCSCFRGFACPWCFIEPWHKWMRIRIWIFERFLYQPCIISLA